MELWVKPGTHAAARFRVADRRRPPEPGELIRAWDATDPHRGTYGTPGKPSSWLVDGIVRPLGPDGEPLYLLSRM